MPKSRRNDPPEEEDQLDVVAINERISLIARDSQVSIHAQNERFNQLEEGLDGRFAGLDARFAAMTRMLADAISRKQRDTAEGSNSALHINNRQDRSESPGRHETRREY